MARKTDFLSAKIQRKVDFGVVRIATNGPPYYLDTAWIQLGYNLDTGRGRKMAIGMHILILAKDAQIIRAHLAEPDPCEERPAWIAYRALMRRLDVDGGHVILHPDEARIILDRLRYDPWNDLYAMTLWKHKAIIMSFLGRKEAKDISDRAKAGVANG